MPEVTRVTIDKWQHAYTQLLFDYVFVQTSYVNPKFTVACSIDCDAYSTLQACDDTITDWCQENLNDSEHCFFKFRSFRLVAFTNEVALLHFTLRFSDVILETAYETAYNTRF